MRSRSFRSEFAAQAALRGVPRSMAGGAGLNARARGRPQAAPQVSNIEDLSHEGRGVTHHGGKVVFVEDALPGERVEWQQTKRGPNFDEARLVRIVEPSPDRV